AAAASAEEAGAATTPTATRAAVVSERAVRARRLVVRTRKSGVLRCPVWVRPFQSEGSGAGGGSVCEADRRLARSPRRRRPSVSVPGAHQGTGRGSDASPAG